MDEFALPSCRPFGGRAKCIAIRGTAVSFWSFLAGQNCPGLWDWGMPLCMWPTRRMSLLKSFADITLYVGRFLGHLAKTVTYERVTWITWLFEYVVIWLLAKELLNKITYIRIKELLELCPLPT
jgi:hypothetical protein